MIKTYIFSVAAVLIVISCATTREARLKNTAEKIHHRVLTIDTHTDTPMRFSNPEFDISKRNDTLLTRSKLDFPRMKDGGLDAAFFAVFLGQGERNIESNKEAHNKAVSIIQSIHDNISKNSDAAVIALSAKDAYKIERIGKRAIYIGMENGYPIGLDLSNIKKFYNLGVRYVTLCHTGNNDICDSSTDEPEHNGLSDFGKQIVTNMNEIGMIVDISHVSDKSFYDVMEVTNAPVIASHSCAKALCDNPRNMTDDMLRKLAENGGVIQMCILSDYVKTIEQEPKRIEAQNLLREKYKNYNNLPDDEKEKVYQEWESLDDIFPPELATVSDAVDHIDHIVKVAGIDHVGIGTDFDGGGALEDCLDVSQIKNITIELVKRGYTEKDIEKIWSGNLMRVFKTVEQLANK